MLAVLEMLVLGGLFVGSTGVLFNHRFRENKFMVVAAGLVALASTYFLTIEVVKQVVRDEMTVDLPTALPAVVEGSEPAQLQLGEISQPARQKPPTVLNDTSAGPAVVEEDPETPQAQEVNRLKEQYSQVLLQQYRAYFGEECEVMGDGAPKTTFVRGLCRGIRMGARNSDTPGCVIYSADWSSDNPFSVDNCTVIEADGSTNLGSPYNDRFCSILTNGKGLGTCGK